MIKTKLSFSTNKPEKANLRVSDGENFPDRGALKQDD